MPDEIGRQRAKDLAKQAFDTLTGPAELAPKQLAALSTQQRKEHVQHVFLLLAGLAGSLPAVQDALCFAHPTLDRKQCYKCMGTAIAEALGIDSKTAEDLLEQQFEGVKLPSRRSPGTN